MAYSVIGESDQRRIERNVSLELAQQLAANLTAATGEPTIVVDGAGDVVVRYEHVASHVAQTATDEPPAKPAARRKTRRTP